MAPKVGVGIAVFLAVAVVGSRVIGLGFWNASVGICLLLCSAGLALMVARVLRPVVFATLALVVLIAPTLAQSPPGERLIFEKDSAYHRIRISEDSSYRYLRFDRSLQGGMLLRDPQVSPLRYTDYVHLAWIFQPGIKRVLVVGLGAGSIPKRIQRDYPQVAVDSVELDPAVVDVAKRFFQVTEDARHGIIVWDGRQFLRRVEATYDLIVMDAYFAQGIPFHLVTREFFRQMKARLNPGGVVAANIVGAIGGPNSKLFRAIYKTYGTEFSGLYPFPVAFQYGRDEDVTRTIMLFATSTPGLTPPKMAAILEKLQREKRISSMLDASFLEDFFSKPVPTGDVPLLTDDYAPVDILPVHDWRPEQR